MNGWASQDNVERAASTLFALSADKMCQQSFLPDVDERFHCIAIRVLTQAQGAQVSSQIYCYYRQNMFYSSANPAIAVMVEFDYKITQTLYF